MVESLNDPFHPERDYVCLMVMLNEGVPVTTLADYIELQGCWGTDRFGRFKGGFDEQALDALAAYRQHQVHTMGAPLVNLLRAHKGLPPEPPRKLDPDLIAALMQYGWPVEIARTLEPQREAANRRRENNLLALIGVMARIINGQETGTPHPELEGTTLAELISRNYAGSEGVGRKQTVADVLERAEAILDEKVMPKKTPKRTRARKIKKTVSGTRKVKIQQLAANKNS